MSGKDSRQSFFTVASAYETKVRTTTSSSPPPPEPPLLVPPHAARNAAGPPTESATPAERPMNARRLYCDRVGVETGSCSFMAPPRYQDRPLAASSVGQ